MIDLEPPDYASIFAEHDNTEGMSAFALSLWHERIEELAGRSLLTSGRALIVDRYVRACTQYEFRYPLAMAEGPTRKSDGGGEYANMNWSAIGKLNEQIMKFEEMLLIPPKASEAGTATRTGKRTPADDYLAP